MMRAVLILANKCDFARVRVKARTDSVPLLAENLGFGEYWHFALP